MISIRVRLALWYTAILLGGLLALAALTSFTLSRLLIADIDASLEKWARSAETVLVTEASTQPLDHVHDEIQEFSSTLPEGSILRVQDLHGPEFFHTDASIVLPPVPDRDGDAAGYTTARTKGLEYRILTRRIAVAGLPYRLQLAVSLGTVNTLQKRFRAVLLWITPIVLAIASLGGLWISSRALAPVDALTYAARAISLQNLSQRLQVPRAHDELRRLSQTWNEMLDRLEAAVKRLSQFTADASHELRSPIALIRTTTEIALSEPRPAAQYRVALEQVMSASLRVSKLIEDLLELTRADIGRNSLPFAELDLRAVAREVHSEMLPITEARTQEFLVRTCDSPALVLGNGAALRRLLIILLDNAIKYTSPGGRIELVVEREGSEALVRVVDSGIGISPTALPHIFERFFRADVSRNPVDGAGLGLAIAQGITRAHGAVIEVASQHGSGSIFSFRIPLSNFPTI
jgi:heavy metal sensor kinase